MVFWVLFVWFFGFVTFYTVTSSLETLPNML